MNATVLSTTLPNGLTVLTQEIHDAPVATFWIWYRVGGRNEVAGTTGISHWVEHMLFKGTPTFGKGATAREVTRNGGTFNGFTWIDFTAFFETLPADRLDLALRIESDRMVNAAFDPDEVTSERTVILSEREGSENYPTFHLGEEVLASAFKTHPYGQGVIGWKCDLNAITRDDLFNWYKRYYTPNNAVAVAVGDFRTSDLLARVSDLFGSIPPGPAIPDLRSIEPVQFGERRVEVRRPGPTPYIEMAYHSPAASHADTPALIVLDAILSGARPMGMGGHEGALGRSSRLYRRLVESGMTTAAGSSFGLTRDPYLFSMSATPRTGIDLATVERTLTEEIDKIQQTGVTEEEIAKSRKQVRAQFVYGSEGVSGQAYWLGSLEIVSNHQLAAALPALIQEVTGADVQRVAREYLGTRNRTVGWFIPDEPAGSPPASTPFPSIQPCWYDKPQAGSSEVESMGRRRPFVDSGATGGSRASGQPARLTIDRGTLSNGIAVISHTTPGLESVVIRASVRAGALFDPADKPGIASFAARMLQRGTARQSFAELNELTDSIGATLSTGGSSLVSQVSVRCLVEDFDRMVDVLSEVLREPSFPQGDIENYRGQVLTRLREQSDDPGSVAEKLFYELAYPSAHPYRHWEMGDEQSVASFTRDDLVAFHRRFVRPAGMNVAVVGGLPFDRVQRRLSDALGDWRDDGLADSFDAPGALVPDGFVRRNVAIAGKSQTSIVMGLPTISRKSPDYYALSFASLVLGGLGMMGRLGDVVRDQMGLAYHVSCDLDSTLGPGAWEVHAGVNAANVDSAIEAIRGEVRRLRDEPISDAELADGKAYLTGILPLALETSAGVARVLQQIEIYGHGLDYLEKHVAAIEALTKEGIQEAASRYLSADNLIAIVAG